MQGNTIESVIDLAKINVITQCTTLFQLGIQTHAPQQRRLVLLLFSPSIPPSYIWLAECAHTHTHAHTHSDRHRHTTTNHCLATLIIAIYSSNKFVYTLLWGGHTHTHTHTHTMQTHMGQTDRAGTHNMFLVVGSCKMYFESETVSCIRAVL